MYTVDNTSRVLTRALQVLTVIVTLFVAFLVMTLATSAMAESSDYTAEVIRLVNVEREKAGVPALSEDVELTPAANVRAQEASKKFSHTRPDGSKWKTVFDEFSISASYRGENLAKGQKTPKAVVKAWMASEGHRANILNPEFQFIAVGLYEKGGVLYWSQLFLKAPQYAPVNADGTTLTADTAVSGQVAQVVGLDLNVRSAASSKSKVVAVAAEGSSLSILDVSGSWAHVRMADGTEGWASMKYLAA